MSARLRGLLALGLCLCLALALLPAPAQAAAPTTNWADEGNYDTAWYGDGSAATFTISTAAELAGFSKLSQTNNFSGKTVTLAAGVDLSDHLWEPIGSFSGTFDGGGHTVSGLIISSGSSSNSESIGLFGIIGSGGAVHGLHLRNASVTATYATSIYDMDMGIIAGRNEGAIYDCAVSGSISGTTANESSARMYMGGLAGKSSGTVKNSSAVLASFTVSSKISSTGSVGVGGVVGDGSAENCFAHVNAVTLTAPSLTPKQYRVAPTASYSYWDAATKLTDGGTPTYTQSYAVSAEQIAGTGSALISSTPTDSYAHTNSLVTAMNNWAAVNPGHGAWGVLRDGMPVPAVFVPTYIDVGGPLNDVTHQSATGDIETGMDLKGQVQESVSLLSVTMPSAIPFIVDVEANGAFKRVLSATGTLTNRSDTGVNITLTAVTDDGHLLGKVDLSLVPDPAPAGGNVALSVGTGKSDVLSTLAAQTGGVPTTATLKVDGAAKAGAASVGADGARFTVGLTLKVSKT